MKNRNKVTNIVINHIKNNAKDYIVLVLFFILGIVASIFFINNTEMQKKQEINNYISEFIASTKETENIEYNELLKDSLVKNIIFCFVMWFAGLTITLVPLLYGIIAFRGFCLGYTISSLIISLGTANGVLISVSALLLQNLLYIPAMLGIALSGIRFYRSVIKNNEKLKDKRKKLKLEIIRHSFFSFIMTCTIMLSSIIEAYMSSNLINILAKKI